MFNHGFNCDRCGANFFTTDYCDRGRLDLLVAAKRWFVERLVPTRCVHCGGHIWFRQQLCCSAQCFEEWLLSSL
jgi:hypothetical protein